MGGDTVFVAGCVTWLPFMKIKAGVGDWLLANGTTKMFGMPICVQSSEKRAFNGF
jgi:hypothetical protein